MDDISPDPFGGTSHQQPEALSEPPPPRPWWDRWWPPSWWPPEPRTWWIAGGGAATLVVIVAVIAIASGGNVASGPTTSDPTGTTTAAPGDASTTTTSTLVPLATTPPDTRVPGEADPLAFFGISQPIAVKIDNSPDAWPQIGLHSAEVIFEVPVEGGLTRFTAVYLGARPQVVGPVRSVRPVDADLLAAFQPVLASTGGQSFVKREIAAAGITEVTLDTAGDLFQVLERAAPFNIVATISLISRQSDGTAPTVAPLPMGGAALSGERSGTVRIPFSALMDVTWTWDGSQYVRSVNGDVFEALPEFDEGLEPLTTETILVLKAAQRSAGYTDSAGADVPTFDIVGFGSFVAFHGGEHIEGEWRRAAQEDGYRLITSDGTQIQLPGSRIFVEIVPRFVDLEIS